MVIRPVIRIFLAYGLAASCCGLLRDYCEQKIDYVIDHIIIIMLHATISTGKLGACPLYFPRVCTSVHKYIIEYYCAHWEFVQKILASRYRSVYRIVIIVRVVLSVKNTLSIIFFLYIYVYFPLLFTFRFQNIIS